jgi:hypothetical protein
MRDGHRNRLEQEELIILLLAAQHWYDKYCCMVFSATIINRETYVISYQALPVLMYKPFLLHAPLPVMLMCVAKLCSLFIK